MGENFLDEVQMNQCTTVGNIAVLKTKYHIIIFPEQIFKNPGEVGQLHQGSLDRVQDRSPVHKIEKIISDKKAMITVVCHILLSHLRVIFISKC